MPSSFPAFWSAFAATCSAIAAMSILLIQRWSFLESARPELVLTDWSRRKKGEGVAANDVIGFQTIRNVGRGAALHITLNASSQMNENRPTSLVPTRWVSILAANEVNDINGEIQVVWGNVNPSDAGFKLLRITIRILCMDSRGRHHETRYILSAVESSTTSLIYGGDPIAPGVIATRTTSSISRWRHRLNLKARRLPGLGRLRR